MAQTSLSRSLGRVARAAERASLSMLASVSIKSRLILPRLKSEILGQALLILYRTNRTRRQPGTKGTSIYAESNLGRLLVAKARPDLRCDCLLSGLPGKYLEDTNREFEGTAFPRRQRCLISNRKGRKEARARHSLRLRAVAPMRSSFFRALR